MPISVKKQVKIGIFILFSTWDLYQNGKDGKCIPNNDMNYLGMR